MAKEIAHQIIADLYDLPVRDMGAGLRIVCQKQNWMTVEKRDLIVRAVKELADRDKG